MIDRVKLGPQLRPPNTNIVAQTHRRNSDEIKVFIHLGPGFGAAKWFKRYERGLIPGLNEPLPYGYYRARGDGLWIEYSEDADEGPITSFLRRSLCQVAGFDVIHAWRNREGLLNADIVWAHTEREHLAALLLFSLLAPDKRPSIIAQCIWLFDQWPRFGWVRRSIYVWLLRRADIVTTLSPENLNAARRLLPGSRTELVMFGVKSDSLRPPRRSPCRRPVRIGALGSDMHRDWKTLLRAFGGIQDFELRIASAKVSPRSTRGASNVEVEPARTEEQVKMLYEWADIIVVPLNPNLHASGLSVILEATIFGLPVISTDTGGLRAYFSNEEVHYVPIADALAMRRAGRELAEDDERRFRLADAAQRRIVEGGLSSERYALRHRRLSQELLGQTRLQVPLSLGRQSSG